MCDAKITITETDENNDPVEETIVFKDWWMPTMFLRWLVTVHSSDLESQRLQQLWRKSSGQEEWRNIEEKYEEED